MIGLVEFRRCEGLERKQLAGLIGVSVQAVGRYEIGERALSSAVSAHDLAFAT